MAINNRFAKPYITQIIRTVGSSPGWKTRAINRIDIVWKQIAMDTRRIIAKGRKPKTGNASTIVIERRFRCTVLASIGTARYIDQGTRLAGR